MRTRKRKPLTFDVDSASPSASASDIQPQERVDSPDSQKNNERISFYIDNEGMPQWERVQTKTLEQLKSIFSNEATQAKLGFKPPTKEAFEVGFDATEANGVLDLLEVITSLGASKVFDVPTEITSKAFTYSPLHREKLVPPFARLMNKWGPSLLKTWKDEIGAGIVFLSVTNAQVRVMRHLEAQRKAQQPKIVSEMPRRATENKESKMPEPEAPSTSNEENPVLDALNTGA